MKKYSDKLYFVCLEIYVVDFMSNKAIGLFMDFKFCSP